MENGWRDIKKKYSIQRKKQNGEFTLKEEKEIQRRKNLSHVFKDGLVLNKSKVQVVKSKGKASSIVQHPDV